MIQQKKMQSNILTLVAPAYKETIYNMPFIDSMLVQTQKDAWKALCIHNGPWGKCPTLKEKLSVANQASTGRILFSASPINTGNWGTANRQQAIDECDTEYILQTSIQDYWLPQAMEYIIDTLEKNKPDVLIWNSINHLVGPCQVLDSQLEWSKIDWGNFCIRTDIAKKIKIKQDQYCADWFFIQDALQSGLVDKNKIMKLPYILTIHN